MIICMNLLSVKYYGLFEVIFSLLKVVAIVIFLIVGLFIDIGVIGDERIGFKYWKDPGIFSEIDSMDSLGLSLLLHSVSLEVNRLA